MILAITSTMKTMMKTKKKILAISAVATAIPVKPNIAATIEMMKNTKAQ